MGRSSLSAAHIVQLVDRRTYAGHKLRRTTSIDLGAIRRKAPWAAVLLVALPCQAPRIWHAHFGMPTLARRELQTPKQRLSRHDIGFHTAQITCFTQLPRGTLGQSSRICKQQRRHRKTCTSARASSGQPATLDSTFF